MTHTQLLIAVNTVWVVVAAVLVMFMQAGFALLEAGLTRMKNAAHIAGKNVLIFGVASVVYWLVGFGIAFGHGNGFLGLHGFAPSVNALISVGKAPFDAFTSVPGGAAWLFQVVFAGVSLAIVWGAMAERAKLWVYFAFGGVFTIIYSLVSHWIWAPGGWLQRFGMQDFAGSTVVHYQGALAALAGALLLGPRIGKFGHDGRANAIPGHNMPYAVLGTLILWFGWFGFNPGSTLGVVTGGHVGFFGYVALTTNLAAAAGGVGGICVAWVVLRKPDISMMLNGVLAALVAVTAACGFVDAWAAALIGFVAAGIAVVAVPLVERLGIDDPIGAVAVHGMAGVWGTLATGNLRAAFAGRDGRRRPRRAPVHGLAVPARRAGDRPRRRRRVHVQRVVRLALGDEAAVGDPRRGARRDCGAGRLGARNVGLSRVLHPGSRRLRDGESRPLRARAPRTCASAKAAARGGCRLIVRDMEAADWPAVRAIFEEGIASGNATFETEAPSWEAWDAGHAELRLVAERDAVVAGWAALSDVSGRCCYRGVGEVSVYIAEAARGAGIGRALLEELVARSETAGYWTLQAGIFPENEASLRLHRACGFRDVGIRERLGEAGGRWRDVVLLERRSAIVGA